MGNIPRAQTDALCLHGPLQVEVVGRRGEGGADLLSILSNAFLLAEELPRDRAPACLSSGHKVTATCHPPAP